MRKSKRSTIPRNTPYTNSKIYNDQSSYSYLSSPQYSLQGKSNQFTITVYKSGNDQFSLVKPTITPMMMTINSGNTIMNRPHITTLFPFKKRNWVSKLRSHDKTFRNAKNMKNLSKDIVDGIFYNAYQQLEAGPSVLPKRKYCDYTGFETNYTEINTGIRFYDAKIFQLFQKMSQPVKDQYLNIRKALIRLK